MLALNWHGMAKERLQLVVCIQWLIPFYVVGSNAYINTIAYVLSQYWGLWNVCFFVRHLHIFLLIDPVISTF